MWSRRIKSRALRASTVVSLALCLAISMAPRPARSEPLTVGAIIGLYEKAYDIYSKVTALMGGDGPALASQLVAVRSEILAQLRNIRDQSWNGETEHVFQNFITLGVRDKNDPDNYQLWSGTVERSKQAINFFNQIVEYGDGPSSYALAPAFNTLVTVHTGLTKMKGEITPMFPAKWMEFHLPLRMAMSANYLMVGAQSRMCWPGFNPGAGNYNITNAVNGADFNGTWYRAKVLYKHLSYGRFFTRFVDTGGGWPFTAHDCTLWDNTCREGLLTTWHPVNWRDETNAWAVDEFKPDFDADPVVQIVRASSKAIMSVGGGNDPWDGASSDLPASGKLVDPWVGWEPDCESYPMVEILQRPAGRPGF